MLIVGGFIYKLAHLLWVERGREREKQSSEM